jgi:hypothetical protein
MGIVHKLSLGIEKMFAEAHARIAKNRAQAIAYLIWL